MLITDYLKKECVIVDLSADSKGDLFQKLMGVQLAKYPYLDKAEAEAGLTEREKIMSTGIGNGIAIPHARIISATDISASVGLLKNGLEYGAVDSKPVFLAVLVFFPKEAVNSQLKFLARISRILNDKTLKDELLGCATSEDFIDTLSQFEQTHLH